MTPSEAYLRLAKEVIKHTITHRKGADLWWSNESLHRQKAELTPEHEQYLITILDTKFPRPNQENPMVNMNDAFPSKYLSAADLNGTEPTVTIASCTMEKLGDDHKPILYFQGKQKGLTLNKTNATTLSTLYGPESDNWIGQQVTLYSIWTEFQGKPTQGLRVRGPAGAVPPHMANAPMNQQAPQQAPTSESSFDDQVPF